MPCDCPEDQPRPVPTGGCNYLVYSGGPMASFYRLVEHAMPNAEMAHGRPTVHPDGSLEFPGSPLVIPGYRPEGSRLVPAWSLCALRMLRVQVIDGVLRIAGICGGPAAAPFTQEVTPERCQACPARQARL
jgi:hypothetical protein